MKAAVLDKLGEPIKIRDVKKPEIGSREVLVKTSACGICGTDIHIQDGWGYIPELPFVMGHEPSGVVVEVGREVERLKVGDRVITNHFYTCGHCFYCRTNRETLCENLAGILGVLKYWGGYGEYFSVPERQAFVLPDEIDDAEGAAICDAVVTAYHAIERGRVSASETVLVIGAGGCGLSAIQLCAMKGARVVSVDISSEKLSNSLLYGASQGINASISDPVEEIRKLTGGFGVDCVIDTVGNTQTLTQSCDAVCRGGRVVILGYTKEHYSLSPQKIAVNELEIIGTRSGGRECTIQSINFVARKDWKSIVSDIYPIDQVNEALAKLRSGDALGRIVLKFD